MSYCTPCPPCDTNFPILCEPLEVTTQAKRLVVEDSAACQKTLVPPLTEQVLKSSGVTGQLTWTNGSNNSLVVKDSSGAVEMKDGSSLSPIVLPNISQDTTSVVAKQLVMMADGTVKVWEPSLTADKFIAYWDGGDWRVNTLNSILPAGNGSVFIRNNSGILQAITGNSNDILTMVGSTPSFVTPGSSNAFPAGHIYGLLLSNNGTDPNKSIDISSGECRDSTAVENIILSSTLTKSATAAFVAGTGQPGLLGGTPNPTTATTLHVLIIRGASGVDVGFHANPTISLASLPTGYNQYYRRIGSIITDSAGNIESFFQNGDRFLLKTPYKAASTRDQTIAATGTSITLYVPNGIRVIPLIRGISAHDRDWTFYDIDQGITSFPSSSDPSSTDFIPAANSNSTFYEVGSNAEFVLTNTSRQIGVIGNAVMTTMFNWDIWGWIDQRNRLQP